MLSFLRDDNLDSNIHLRQRNWDCHQSEGGVVLPGGSPIRMSSSQTVMDVVGVIAVGCITLVREKRLSKSSGAIAVLKNCFSFLNFLCHFVMICHYAFNMSIVICMHHKITVLG